MRRNYGLGSRALVTRIQQGASKTSFQRSGRRRMHQRGRQVGRCLQGKGSGRQTRGCNTLLVASGVEKAASRHRLPRGLILHKLARQPIGPKGEHASNASRIVVYSPLHPAPYRMLEPQTLFIAPKLIVERFLGTHRFAVYLEPGFRITFAYTETQGKIPTKRANFQWRVLIVETGLCPL